MIKQYNVGTHLGISTFQRNAQDLWLRIVEKHLKDLPISRKRLLRIKFDSDGNMIKGQYSKGLLVKIHRPYQYARDRFNSLLKEFEKKES